MNRTNTTIYAGFAALLISGTVGAAPIEIKFASPTPPKAHLNVQIFAPWSKEVTAASGGTLKVTLVAGPTLASHRNVYDRVRQGVAAIGWGLQALVPGQFPRSSVVQIPGIGDDSSKVSLAFWRMYKKGILGKEYDDVKVLAIWSFPPYAIHTKTPLKSIADLKGMKIGVNGKTGSDVVKALGGTAISLAPPQYYQSISRGLVSGAFISWTGVPPYRLNEVTRFTVEGPLGGNAGMIVMNKDAYNKLPPKAKKAIDDASGEKLVRRFSAFWDRIQAGSRKRLGTGPKHTIVPVSAADRTKMLNNLTIVETQWAKRIPGGAKVVDALKAELASVKSGK